MTSNCFHKNYIRLLLVFLISVLAAHSGFSQFRKIKVCAGKPTVLVLKGYERGNTLWEQSPDSLIWSPATGTAFNDSLLISVDSTMYFRASIKDGNCNPDLSEIILLEPDPNPPRALIASNVSKTEFDVNWTIVEGASNYYLDIAYDSTFKFYVDGYKNLEMGNLMSFNFFGANCNNEYFYRLRAFKDSCGISGNSNVVKVNTLACPVSKFCSLFSQCNGDMTDARDNKKYKTTQIYNQCWMAENLNVGTMIQSQVAQGPGADNQNASIEKYCYNNDAANCTIYGGLYLWEEMMAYGLADSVSPGPRGICPTGWHLPTDNEWKCLEMNLGMTSTDVEINGIRGNNQGNDLKTAGFGAAPLWKSPSGGNNKTGFSGLPLNRRYLDGTFDGVGSSGIWWTTTEMGPDIAWNRSLYYNTGGIYRENFLKNTSATGVRCIKD